MEVHFGLDNSDITLEYILQIRILPENFSDLQPFEHRTKYSDKDDFGFVYDELQMLQSFDLVLKNDTMFPVIKELTLDIN